MELKIALVTQARYGSSRLEGKILKQIQGKSILEIHLLNARKSKLATHFFVATTNEKESELIVNESLKCNWDVARGSTDDVLSRFWNTVKELNPDLVVRVTSDCPFVQPQIIDQAILSTIANDYDYLSTSLDFPDGLDVEVFSGSLLKQAVNEAKLSSEREHVTPWIRKNAKKIGSISPDTMEYSNVRLTVDQVEDLECVQYLNEIFGAEESWIKYAEYVKANPSIFKNQVIIRNEGYINSLKND